MHCTSQTVFRNAAVVVESTNLRNRGRISAVMFGIVVAVTSLPPSAQGRKIAIEKGGSREYHIQLTSDCHKSVTWRIDIRNLKIASTVKRKVKLPPNVSHTVVVNLDSTKSRRRTFQGSIILDCVDCARKQCAAGDVRIVKSLEVRVIDLGPFGEKANEFVRAADLPVRLSGWKAAEEISQENLQQTTRRLVLATAFLGADGEPTRPRDNADDPGFVDLVADLTARQLARPGHFLVEMTWRRKNGETFSTLAAADVDGRVIYEPILHFNSLATLETPEPRRGSWIWGPWQLKRRNGLGVVCLDVEWTVRMLTNGCKLIDPPGPPIEVSSGARCWGWDQETVHGYTPYWPWPGTDLEHGEDCGAGCPDGEQCITWGVFTYWTQGLSTLLVEACPGGFHAEIPVDRKVILKKSQFGLDGYKPIIRHLCACSGERP